MTLVTDEKFIFIDAAEAERHYLSAERRRLKHAKYNAKRPHRANGRVPMRDRPFIVWDGEGPQDTSYSLLGNSMGDELCYPTLRTEDCLNFIIEAGITHPNSIHVGFGFTYDVSNILRELSWRHLAALKKFTKTIWKEFEIEHIPRKWFQVKRGNVKVKIFRRPVILCNLARASA